MSTCRMVVASAVLAFASCGVRAPSRIDVAAMVKRDGEANARADLAARIVADPKDIAARLALATLDDTTGRPSGAIEQLEAVVALSGPLGTRWHDDDRARFARLLAARGKARLARDASTALADFRRARDHGAEIDPRELERARILLAIAQLRHVDAKERAAGKRILAELWQGGATGGAPRVASAGSVDPAAGRDAFDAGTNGRDPSWAGARANATANERGAFGIWLWKQRAHRAAWEELRAWRDATPSPRDPALGAPYLTAYAWWTPVDGPTPDPDELVGPDRCRYTTIDGCSFAEILARGDDAALEARMLAPPAVTRDARDAAGWLAATLVQALRGEGSWGAAFAARVDLASIKLDGVPGPLRPALWFLAGNGAAAELGTIDPTARDSLAQRLVMAAGRVLRGNSVAQVRDALGTADGADQQALLRIVAPVASRIDRPHAAAVVAHVRARVPAGPDEAALRRVADAYARDPVIADRLGRAAVATAIDAATAHAALGALFQALNDPARARASWQAAVELSPDIDLQRGFADALARAKDPDAALVAAVTAAAAWGDPSVVWVSVARGLDQTGEYVHALEAARNAIGLASGRTLIAAYDVAISASRSLQRDAQAGELYAARGRITPAIPERRNDPTDPVEALAEYRKQPTAATAARIWIASRWNPRNVAARAALLSAIGADDPRRSVIIAELVALAADRDHDLGRDAIAALR